MNTREQSAYNAGIEAMRQAAMVAAVTIEARDDAKEIRNQAAAAALHGLAEGARGLLQPEPVQSTILAFTAIAAETGQSGSVDCPHCSGRLNWARDSHNGHVHGECETTGCLSWVQ